MTDFVHNLCSEQDCRIRDAPRAPFNDDDADIIFDSSDGVIFKLHKVTIAKASSVMRDMFMLPGNLSKEPQTVKLTEDGRTLDHLFRLCCPVERPTIGSVDDLHAVLEAARKYDMVALTKNFCGVEQLIVCEPLRVYAVACLTKMASFARAAANRLLDDPHFHVPPDMPEELKEIPASAIYAVHTYRQRCAVAAKSVMSKHDWLLNAAHERKVTVNGNLHSSWVWVRCARYSSPNCPQGSNLVADCGKWESPKRYSAAQWWWAYYKAVGAALETRPSGRTVRAFLQNNDAAAALKGATQCEYCAKSALSDLALFNELLAQKIDAAVSSAKLDLPFDKSEKSEDT